MKIITILIIAVFAAILCTACPLPQKPNEDSADQMEIQTGTVVPEETDGTVGGTQKPMAESSDGDALPQEPSAGENSYFENWIDSFELTGAIRYKSRKKSNNEKEFFVASKDKNGNPSDLSQLIAKFNTRDISVTINGIPQHSGITENDFSRTGLAVYTVEKIKEGSMKYVITVKMAVNREQLIEMINAGEDVTDVETFDITDMSRLFYGNKLFNQDISRWDVSNVTTMNGMFAKASGFDQDIGSWNLGKVTDVSFMFYSASVFNQDIGNWDLGNVGNMAKMFSFASAFNQDLNNWNVSSVSDMSCMFWCAFAFNGDISRWDVGNVTDMNSMFVSSASFNQDISGWDVSKVTDMRGMFVLTRFNADISPWDVGSVTNMSWMFSHTHAFNQNISRWDVSNVTDMRGMFVNAVAFNQDISVWREQLGRDLWNESLGDGISVSIVSIPTI